MRRGHSRNEERGMTVSIPPEGCAVKSLGNVNLPLCSRCGVLTASKKAKMKRMERGKLGRCCVPTKSRTDPEGIPNKTATVPCPNLVPFLSAGWGCSETLHLLSLPLCSRCGVPTATKESEFAPFPMSEGSRCGVPTATKESEFAHSLCLRVVGAVSSPPPKKS